MLVTLFFLFYKGETLTSEYGLPYPYMVWQAEIVGLIFFFFLQFYKIFAGSKGNKTEKAGITLVFVVLSFICFGFFLFFLLGQTYV